MSYAITAPLVRVGSEEDLETGSTTFRLGFRLPTGDVVYAMATNEEILRLRNYDAAQNTKAGHPLPTRPAPPPPMVQLMDEQETEEVDEPDDQGPDGRLDSADSVEWLKLPETFLPERVKAAMLAFKVGNDALPPMLVLQQVVQMRDAILAEYTASDWEQLGFGPEDDPATEEAAQLPAVGAIQWEPGSTREPIQRPQRKVSRVDGKGNPIVKPNPNDVDPGEVADIGDEDSVEQF